MDLIHCCCKFVLKCIGGKTPPNLLCVSTNINHNEDKLISMSGSLAFRVLAFLATTSILRVL